MNIDALINGLPGAAAQGLIWGIVAIGIYITYKILDIADLTVDGSLGTGGAVCVMMMLAGYSNGMSLAAAFVIGMVTGLVTGLLHTFMGIPAILAGILTQLGLYSVNLKIMGSRANTPINPNNYDLLVSLRNVKNVPFYENAIFITAVITLVIFVFRDRIRLHAARNRRKRGNVPSSGCKCRIQQSCRTYDIKRISCVCRRPSRAVSGLCRCKYGARGDSYRSCGCCNR